eukprot:m.161633 g.161633  ORF g.161633 m.161633 type:complete len:75 (-) comp18051_c0_seq1:45-269(-)
MLHRIDGQYRMCLHVVSSDVIVIQCTAIRFESPPIVSSCIRRSPQSACLCLPPCNHVAIKAKTAGQSSAKTMIL